MHQFGFSRRAALRLLPLFALLLGVIAATGPLAETSTTIILVRHAEKAAEPVADPPLTAEGQARALALVDVLRGAGVQAIYSTRYVRTRTTAAPFAERAGLSITIFDPPAPPGPLTAMPRPENDYGAQYAAEILSKHRGHVVLVVGHSNTVPLVLRGLGIADASAIADSEHDNLFIVTVPETGPARMVRARYGR